MKGDFSRLRFDPEKQYEAVLVQQGRVALDSDANEASAIAIARDRRTSADIIGPVGAPLADPGFGITLEAGGKLGIGPGTLYVDGIRCHNPGKFLHDAQPFLAPAAPVFLNPPNAPATTPADGRYYAFLEVWYRHVTALEDPDISEEALGFDTTTRLQVVEQVRFLWAGNAGDSAISCDAANAAWTTLITPPNGTLAARGKPADTAANPCAFPETAGYQRLENHLYRIEIHNSGTPGSGATYKWSRDNAYFATRWLESNGNTLTLADTGRDAQNGLKQGQWIELTDDDRELAGQPGTLVRISNLLGQRVVLDAPTADGPIDIASFGRGPKIRAWDSPGAVTASVPGSNQGFVAVENGLEIAFANGTRYRSGDHWLIPARSGSGIEWPMTGSNPAQLAPFGVERRYARLAVLDAVGGNWTLIGDCRPLFPALSAMRQIAMLGGDGQEALPDPLQPATLCPLPQPLRVGVFRGTAPVEGARVRLRILTGAGRLDRIPPAAAAASIIVTTNVQGEATASWALDATTASQTVRAELLDSTDTAVGLPVSFAASLSTAARVSFDPANSPSLAGVVTVQKAIEELAKRTGGGCVEVTLSPGTDWGKILAELPKGEDVTICFRQGDFITDDPVVVEGLGHVDVHGGGRATRLIGRKGETVIEFRDCTSLAMRSLSITAAADFKTPTAGRNGALTVTACALTTIEDLDVRCGAALGDERTCITVRGIERDGVAEPLRHVRVAHCRMTAGFGQTGLLVTDARDTIIADNRLTVSHLPKDYTFAELVAEERRLGRMSEWLARNFAEADAADDVKLPEGSIKVGPYVVGIKSMIPREEWRALAEALPPTEEERASAASMETYVKRITSSAIGDGTGGRRAFRTAAKRVRDALGDAQVEAEKVGAVLVGEMEVIEVGNRQESDGERVAVQVGNFRIAFDSELNQATWDAIIRKQRKDLKADSAAAAIEAIERLTRSMVVDAEMRKGVDRLERWYKRVEGNLATVGARAIVVAGAAAESARVSGNAAAGFAEGVRVALSRANEPRDGFVAFGSVTVTGNRLEVQMPAEQRAGGQAIYVGNTERARIADNEVDAAEGGKARRHGNGIRLWGYLGSFAHLTGNIVTNARIGLHVVDVDPPAKEDVVQWLAAHNHAPGSATTVLAPERMTREGNTP